MGSKIFETDAKENLLDFKLYSAMNSLMSKFSGIQNGVKQDLLPEVRTCVEILINGANPESLHKNFKINIYQFLCNVSTFSSVRLQQLGLTSKVRLAVKLLLLLLQLKAEDDIFSGSSLLYCSYTYEFIARYGYDISSSIYELLKIGETSYLSKSVVLSLPQIVVSKRIDSDLFGRISKAMGQMLLIQCRTDDKKSTYGKRGTSKLPVYTELDGSQSRDVFTVLTFASNQQSDVLQSIYTFSVLKLWLVYLKENNVLYEALDFQLSKLTRGGIDIEGSPYAVGTSQFYDDASTDSDSLPSMASSFSSLQSFPQTGDDRSLNVSKLTINESPSIAKRKQFDTLSITSDIISTASNIRNIVCRYCIRVIQQSEKLPRHKSDKSLIIASVVESIQVLDLLCFEDFVISQKVFMEIKRLHHRIEKDPFSYRKIFVALIQFCIHHHEEMLFPIDKILQTYFSIMPDKKYYDQFAAFEFFKLCVSNKDYFCNNQEIISHYAPNILKLFVWWPMTFTNSMRDVLEIIITQNNVLEMFHMIIDLPILSIAMFLKHQRILDNEAKLKEFFYGEMKPYFAAMFAYFLRTKSTGIDTIDRLQELFAALQEMQSHPRVSFAAQLVPFLLLEYFDIVYCKEDKELLKLLFPVILERIFYLYPDYVSEEIQTILCDQLINIAELVPEVFEANISDMHTFMNQLQLVRFYHPEFFKKFIWSVGEFGSNGSCSYDDVAKLFTALEANLSEMMDKIGKSVNNLNNAEVITSLIIALSKLATHSQDLMQRLSIRLSKLLQIPYERMSEQISMIEFLSIQQLSHQMIKTMQKPNVVESLLRSDTRKNPWHSDEHNSLLLKVHMLVDSKRK